MQYFPYNKCIDMNKNIKKAIEKMFIITGDKMPSDESYFKQEDWFLNHSWTEEQEEEYIEWLTKFLFNNWEGFTNHRVRSKKLREKIARSFAFNYGFTFDGGVIIDASK